jgi:hypothetical protein
MSPLPQACLTQADLAMATAKSSSVPKMRPVITTLTVWVVSQVAVVTNAEKPNVHALRDYQHHVTKYVQRVENALPERLQRGIMSESRIVFTLDCVNTLQYKGCSGQQSAPGHQPGLTLKICRCR